MQLVSNEGVYRGFAVESAVGVTSTGLPQFVIGCKASQWYDPDTEEWMDWAEYDQGITGYLCLFGKEGQPLRNAEQVMKIFGWDGTSFDDLDEMDLSEIEFQFRTAEEEYNGKTRMKVQFIDVTDANPAGGVGTVEKLDKDKRSALNKQFSTQLKKLSGGKVKTAKAPASKPKPAPKKDEPAEEAPKEEKKSTPPKRPPAPPKKDKKSKVEIQYDYNSAWSAVEESAPDGVEDDAIVNAWYAALDAHAKDKKEDEITAAQWAKVVKDSKKALKA